MHASSLGAKRFSASEKPAKSMKVLTGVASRAAAGQDTVIPRLIELLLGAHRVDEMSSTAC